LRVHPPSSEIRADTAQQPALAERIVPFGVIATCCICNTSSPRCRFRHHKRRARNDELQPDLRRRSPAARTAARARADGATMRDGHQLALNTPLRGVKDAALQQYHGLNIHHRCGRRAARRCSKMSGWPAMPTTRLPLPTLTTRALTDVVLRASAGAWSSWVHDSSSTLLTAC